MQKANKLMQDILNDTLLDNSNEMLSTIIGTARANNSIKQLILLIKNISSVSSIVITNIKDWALDLENDTRIASLLIILSDLNCEDQITDLSSILVRSPSLRRTKIIAASILLKRSIYGTR